MKYTIYYIVRSISSTNQSVWTENYKFDKECGYTPDKTFRTKNSKNIKIFETKMLQLKYYIWLE